MIELVQVRAQLAEVGDFICNDDADYALIAGQNHDVDYDSVKDNPGEYGGIGHAEYIATKRIVMLTLEPLYGTALENEVDNMGREYTFEDDLDAITSYAEKLIDADKRKREEAFLRSLHADYQPRDDSWKTVHFLLAYECEWRGYAEDAEMRYKLLGLVNLEVDAFKSFCGSALNSAM